MTWIEISLSGGQRGSFVSREGGGEKATKTSLHNILQDMLWRRARSRTMQQVGLQARLCFDEMKHANADGEERLIQSAFKGMHALPETLHSNQNTTIVQN